jgi:plasmid stability protein
VYLPAELKAALKRVARQKGVSEAEVIRDSIRAEIAGEKPRPRPGLFASGSGMAERVDELLDGFGTR